MALCSPSVVGPISPCVNSVRVQNQLVGSTVTVLRNGSKVASGPATWTDQTFDLDPGVTLNPGDKITVTQTSGGADSASTPIAVIVQNKPVAPLNPVTYASAVLNCSNALLISGAVPGATITLKDQTGAVRGTGVASQDGSVGIAITPQLRSGQILQASQTACGLAQASPTPSPLPIEPPSAPPPPIVENPLYACARSVTISGVIPGAIVTLTRTAGPTESGAFVVSAEYFNVAALNPLETVTASQAFPDCRPEVKVTTSASVKVGRAQPPQAPIVIGPLCPDALTVRLTGLTVGDSVEVY
jgi:Bacterial Ig domain